MADAGFTSAKVRGVVVSRPDPDRLYDPERPIRITVADSAFAELSDGEAYSLAAHLIDAMLNRSH